METCKNDFFDPIKWINLGSIRNVTIGNLQKHTRQDKLANKTLSSNLKMFLGIWEKRFPRRFLGSSRFWWVAVKRVARLLHDSGRGFSSSRHKFFFIFIIVVSGKNRFFQGDNDPYLCCLTWEHFMCVGYLNEIFSKHYTHMPLDGSSGPGWKETNLHVSIISVKEQTNRLEPVEPSSAEGVSFISIFKPGSGRYLNLSSMLLLENDLLLVADVLNNAIGASLERKKDVN